MKPRLFVGSSGKASNYAEALHDSLTDIAECTVWTEGAFGLSLESGAFWHPRRPPNALLTSLGSML
jgi:hypothetical protein